jgi:hypothetical protein
LSNSVIAEADQVRDLLSSNPPRACRVQQADLFYCLRLLSACNHSFGLVDHMPVSFAVTRLAQRLT